MQYDRCACESAWFQTIKRLSVHDRLLCEALIYIRLQLLSVAKGWRILIKMTVLQSCHVPEGNMSLPYSLLVCVAFFIHIMQC